MFDLNSSSHTLSTSPQQKVDLYTPGGLTPTGAGFFENVIGSQSNTNTLTGNANNNLLVGGDMNDILAGGAEEMTLLSAGWAPITSLGTPDAISS